MITFPRGFHAGFNFGYNCAESTNFASPRWVQIGANANLCECRDDIVRVREWVYVYIESLPR